jgi:anti-sigma regulatory factor (Ser/Thr protein kinase)
MTSASTDAGREDQRPALQLELERNPGAPALARAAVVACCQNRGLSPATMATLRLLVSETVTNAVTHPDVDPPGVIGLSVHIDEATVRVEISDQGRGFTPQPRDPTQLGGNYGLFLVEKESANWGVEQRPHTTVWFELALKAKSAA